MKIERRLDGWHVLGVILIVKGKVAIEDFGPVTASTALSAKMADKARALLN